MRRLLPLTLTVVGLGLLLPTTASAQATDPPNATGECTATATIDNGTVIDPYMSSGVYEVPISGSATYEGSVPTVDTPRPISGKVEILTPPGIPNISIDDDWTWDKPDATGLGESGDVSWDLPSVLPRGVEITVEGSHSESGTVVCDGSVTIEFEGGPFDSPLTPVSLVGTALAGAGVFVAGLAKGVAK